MPEWKITVDYSIFILKPKFMQTFRNFINKMRPKYCFSDFIPDKRENKLIKNVKIMIVCTLTRLIIITGTY